MPPTKTTLLQWDKSRIRVGLVFPPAKLAGRNRMLGQNFPTRRIVVRASKLAAEGVFFMSWVK